MNVVRSSDFFIISIDKQITFLSSTESFLPLIDVRFIHSKDTLVLTENGFSDFYANLPHLVQRSLKELFQRLRKCALPEMESHGDMTKSFSFLTIYDNRRTEKFHWIKKGGHKYDWKDVLFYSNHFQYSKCLLGFFLVLKYYNQFLLNFFSNQTLSV